MLSIVITVYNEEGIVPALIERLERVLENMRMSYEIFFIDDGSIDRTSELVEEAHIRNARIKLLQFSRNFGQAMAIRAGLAHAQGDIVIIMDGDLQDLPEEIPRLVEKLKEGYDVVYAKREQRQDSFIRRFGSRMFVALLRFFISPEELAHGEDVMLAGVFRAMRRNVIDALNALPEHTIYLQGLIHWVGFRKAVIPVTHGERFAGGSHWTLLKLVRYAFDALISFSPYPLRKVSMLGFSIALGAAVMAIWYFFDRLLHGTPMIGFTSLMFVILFLGGMQLFLFGVIGEYIGRMYIETKKRPLFIIKKKLL